MDFLFYHAPYHWKFKPIVHWKNIHSTIKSYVYHFSQEDSFLKEREGSQSSE